RESRLFMNWAEVREMQSAGMDMGSHTHTHRLLSHLAPQQQRDELRISKEILQHQLGTPITAVAYPVGGRNAYTAETCAMAASVGYRLGFNFRRHNNPFPFQSPLDLGRLAVAEPITRRQLQSSICFPRLFAE